MRLPRPRLTRRPRQILLGLIAAVLMIPIVSGLMIRRSDNQYLLLSGNWPVMAEETIERSAMGWTNWLIVEEVYGDPPAGSIKMKLLRRRFSIHAPGLIEALILVAGTVALFYLAWRRLVRRLSLDGYCDYCGYDLHQLTTPRCPECGQQTSETAVKNTEAAVDPG